MQDWLHADFPFGPGVDDKSPEPFMPIPVSQAVQEGVQVPLMIGYNSLEGVFLTKCMYEITILVLVVLSRILCCNPY